MTIPKTAAGERAVQRPKRGRIKTFLYSKNIVRNYDLYLLLIPVLAFYIIFCYGPMYGLQLAFKDFIAVRGILGSPWVGLKHLNRFVNSPYFLRLIGNTLGISVMQLVFGFPIPILLAVMINEVQNTHLKKLAQNITYAPHFLSIVVLVGLVKIFTNYNYGIINYIIEALGGTRVDFMQSAGWFRPLYVISGIWQSSGWGSIIYIAALAGIDVQLHESARLDGASRFQRIWYINLPGILPTIVVLLILNVGQLMNVGFEKAFLMQNDLNLSAADIISTYSYRIGIQGAQYSYATAIGLFNSVVNCVLLLSINAISKRLSENSLW